MEQSTLESDDRVSTMEKCLSKRVDSIEDNDSDVEIISVVEQT